jgi:hypothetical protein
VRFELHLCEIESSPIGDVADLPFRPVARRPTRPALAIWESDTMAWVRVSGRDAPALFAAIPAREPGAMGFQVVRRSFSTYLALRSRRDDLLVNGLPALRFSVLSSQDSILLAEPRLMFYVTERFFPRVGPPLDEAVGRERCAHCRHVLEAGTRVVNCHCGALYHWETAESHSDLSPDDRLDCLERRKACVRCQRELTTQEYLAWNPITI